MTNMHHRYRCVVTTVLLVILSVTFTYGTNFFVDPNHPNANDGNVGTDPNFPWVTPQKAATTALAGDRVKFSPATHVLTADVIQTNDGTPGNPIIFESTNIAARQLIQNPDPLVTDDANMVFIDAGAGFKVELNGDYVVWSGFYHLNAPLYLLNSTGAIVQDTLIYGEFIDVFFPSDVSGIFVINCSDLTIQRVESWDRPKARLDRNIANINLRGVTNARISDSFFYGARNLIFLDAFSSGILWTRNVMWNSGEHSFNIGKQFVDNVLITDNVVVGPSILHFGGQNQFNGFQLEAFRLDGDSASPPIDNSTLQNHTSYGGQHIASQGAFINFKVRNVFIDARNNQTAYLLQEADDSLGWDVDYNAWSMTNPGRPFHVDIKDFGPPLVFLESYEFAEWRTQTDYPTATPGGVPDANTIIDVDPTLAFVNPVATKTYMNVSPFRGRPDGDFTLLPGPGNPLIGRGEFGANIGANLKAGLPASPLNLRSP